MSIPTQLLDHRVPHASCTAANLMSPAGVRQNAGHGHAADWHHVEVTSQTPPNNAWPNASPQIVEQILKPVHSGHADLMPSA